MTVKLKDAITTFNLINAEQIGSKQLFYGYSEIYGTYVYISYNTIIAVKASIQWCITNEYFSSTTTKHKRAIMGKEQCIDISEEYFKSTLEGLRQSNLLKR